MQNTTTTNSRPLWQLCGWCYRLFGGLTKNAAIVGVGCNMDILVRQPHRQNTQHCCVICPWLTLSTFLLMVCCYFVVGPPKVSNNIDEDTEELTNEISGTRRQVDNEAVRTEPLQGALSFSHPGIMAGKWKESSQWKEQHKKLLVKPIEIRWNLGIWKKIREGACIPTQ